MNPATSITRVAFVLCAVLLASLTAASPTSLLPSRSPGETSEAQSQGIEDEGGPGNGSLTRSTKVAISVVLVLSIAFIVALYCLRHWPPVSCYILRKNSIHSPPSVHRLSHDLVFEPHSSATPVARKAHVVQPPLLHRVAERVSAPLASTFGRSRFS